jgi:hypothetical protein
MFSLLFLSSQQGVHAVVNTDQLPASFRYFNGQLYRTMEDDLQLPG